MNEFLEAESEASQREVVTIPEYDEEIAGGALVRRPRGIVAKHPRSQSSEVGSSIGKKKARWEPEIEIVPEEASRPEVRLESISHLVKRLMRMMNYRQALLCIPGVSVLRLL